VAREPLRVLILGDNPDDAELMAAELERGGYAPTWTRVDTAGAFLDRLATEPDVVLADYHLPLFDGSRALALVQSQAAHIPVIILSGLLTIEEAVACLARGAADYLPKSEMARLGASVRHVLERQRLRHEHVRDATRINELNRMLYAVRGVHRLIVRERDAARFLSGACEILNRVEGFGGTWVGRVDEDGTRLVPTAGAVDVAARMSASASSGVDPWGGCPTNRACGTRRPATCADLTTDPACAATLAAVTPLGCTAAAAVPILVGDDLFGALTVFAVRPEILNQETVALLADVAADLGRAVQAIEAEHARQEAERALRASEEHDRTFLERLPLGVYQTSVEGRYVSANRALRELLGYDRDDELFALDVARDVYADPEDRRQLVADSAAAGPDRRSAETRWKRRDGSVVPVRLTVRTLYDGAGAIVGFEGVVEDLTERRALEEQLRQAQKIEAVGQLAGGIAHEFNNLLTTIGASTALLADAVAPGTAYAEDLDAIRRAAARGGELTGKLLAFGRRQRLEPLTFDLAEAVRDFAQLARRVVPASIVIAQEHEPATLPIVADPDAVQQILMNLVTNARDAMPDGGTLGLHTARVRLGPDAVATQGWGAPGSFALLAVKDTGLGMDAAARAHLFEPFFTTKPVDRGTGLGMPMVYGLVQQHHGHIRVLSAPNRGTSVEMLFPLATDQEAVAPPPAEARTPGDAGALGGTELILLVDDEPTLRRAGTRLLERAGYRVVAAADGAEALETYLSHEQEIALIISDIVMPRMSGPELGAELRRRGKSPRLLFTSGYAEKDGGQTHQLGPGALFIQKPWNAASLLAAVREALNLEPTAPSQGPFS